ncbi:MAG: alpha/beta hydrolase [Bacteroidales bacterium]|jgi:hypothetical protein|nr:alpha/beta hydrolase [Bacteroidales bacterium]
MNRTGTIISSILILASDFLLPGCIRGQVAEETIPEASLVYSAGKLETMMRKPVCLGEYITSQAGPLRKINSDGTFTSDSTFTVDKMRIPSEGFLITGWLYMPLNKSKCPLIILTNGGGDNVKTIRSFSDFMAPVLAHCGIAAFVHDKRGTGESQGEYKKTCYSDYITDAANCAIHLSDHDRIDKSRIGVMGASEGGRIAVAAAARYPVFSFVISQAGTVVSPVEDRLFAQLNGMVDQGVMPEAVAEKVRPLWEKSFQAWASGDSLKHKAVNEEISEWRKDYERNVLPFTWDEMNSIPEFSTVLPTWNSLGDDYMTELKGFSKKWLAIFGETDRVVPTEASIENIRHYMSLSGNNEVDVAVLPNCGHAPVDNDTRRMLSFHYLILNWLHDNLCHEM